MNADGFIKKLQITGIINETANAKTFVLEPLDGWQPLYEPGQFITLVFYTASGEKRRSYSLSSAPICREPLSITVKKVDNGEFSRQLIYTAKEGDILFSSGISGYFLLPEKDDAFDQYFFIAAGSGITPCFSLIKTLLQNGNKKIVLIYSNRSKEEIIFYEQLQTLEKKYAERFTIRFLFSNINNVHHSRLSSWLLQLLLKEYLKAPLERIICYLCGPFDYMQMADITLKAFGITSQQIIKENFSSLPRLVIPTPPDTEAHNVTVKINGKEYTLLVQYPHSILATAKTQNITLPYSCEAGRCGSCAATCISGKVWMAYNEVLMDDEIAKGRVLTCQGYPVGGDAVIEF